SMAAILNESAALALGYKDPIGKKLYSSNSDKAGNKIWYTVIGVVKNFNFESLHQSISPLAFFLGKSTGFASFKITTSSINPLVNSIEAKWKSMASGMPFSYRFLDNAFNQMYDNERRVGKIAITFSVLAILIACLGLFGLATFIAEQR